MCLYYVNQIFAVVGSSWELVTWATFCVNWTGSQRQYYCVTLQEVVNFFWYWPRLMACIAIVLPKTFPLLVWNWQNCCLVPMRHSPEGALGRYVCRHFMQLGVLMILNFEDIHPPIEGLACFMISIWASCTLVVGYSSPVFTTNMCWIIRPRAALIFNALEHICPCLPWVCFLRQNL